MWTIITCESHFAMHNSFSIVIISIGHQSNKIKQVDDKLICALFQNIKIIIGVVLRLLHNFLKIDVSTNVELLGVAIDNKFHRNGLSAIF